MNDEILTRHDAAIKKLVEEDEDRVWYHSKFNKSPDGFNLSGFIKFLLDGEERYAVRAHPDAWSIDFSTHTVYWLEVVNWNRISDLKLAYLLRLFWLLDTNGFALELVVHDMTMGTTTTVTPEQMEHWADSGGREHPWKITVPIAEQLAV